MFKKVSKNKVKLLKRVVCSLLLLQSLPVSAATKDTATDIYVEETRQKEELKSESQATTIITAADIKSKQAKSVEEIIFSETGIVRNVDPMGRVSISIRGAEPRHTLILVDGQNVLGEFSKYAGKGDELNRIGTENIERIEIIRGASSAKYGSDAIGGVINIITKKPKDQERFVFNVEMRGTKEENLLPHKNFFLRADAGKTGKLKTAIYGGKRTIMPIKSEKFFYYGVNTTAPVQNTLRYFGDISTIGTSFSYDFTKKDSLEFALEHLQENMNRFTKHSEDAPDPVINYRRNIKRDNLRLSYRGKIDETDFHIDLKSSKMQEDDVTISSIKAFTPYEGQNTLHYLDHILHKEYNLTAKFNTPLGTKHLLSYGLGVAQEKGEGSRIKGAKKTYIRHIDPWDYDKNLRIEEKKGGYNPKLGREEIFKVPSSRIMDDPMFLNENGIPTRDENYAKYGYKDETGKTIIPSYTFEDFDDDENEDKIPAFAEELRRQNPPEAFLDEDGESFADDDDAVVRRYYRPNNFNHVKWHGKEFEEEKKTRTNRQTIGEATINKRHFFIADFFEVDEHTIIQPILRLDHTNLFGTNMSFNLGVTKNLNSKNTSRLKANIGTAYTTPGLGELYYHFEMYAGAPYDIGIGRLGYYWFGNKDLKPERAVNIDLGYEEETKHKRLRVNIFHNRIKNYMTPYFTGELMDFYPEYNKLNNGRNRWMAPPDMIYSFKNLGRAEISGVETEIQGKIDEHFTARLGYTYLHAKNKSDKNMPARLLNKPKHKIDFGLTYQNQKGKVRASLWSDYYINMLDANTIANNGNFVHNDSESGKTEYKFAKSGKQTYESKTFGLWHFILQKDLNPNAMMYVGIDNLFNHRDDDLAMPERIYKMGFNVKFDKIPFKTFSEEENSYLFDQSFIEKPFDTKREKGTKYIGTYTLLHDSFTGKVKPEKARVTETSHVGTAYKNYLEKKEHGNRQKLIFGLDSRIDKKTNFKILGSLQDTKDIEQKKDIGTLKMNKLRLEELDVTRNEDKLTYSLGRLKEKFGTTHYYFGSTFDGIRGVYTDKNTQIRLGFGDFSHSTGIKDSPYTHARNGIFLRTPTKKEWIGYDSTKINDEVYQTGEIKTIDGNSLYAKLKKAKTLKEERAILEEYLKIIRENNTKKENAPKTSVEEILTHSNYNINSHVWRKVTVYNDKGKEVGQFMAVDMPQVDTVEDEKLFDEKHLQNNSLKAFDNNMKRLGEKEFIVNEKRPLSVGASPLIPNKKGYRTLKYKLKFEFYGYGSYQGKETLETLGMGLTSPVGKHYGIPLSKWKDEDFRRLTKEEARTKTGSSLYDKENAFNLKRKLIPDGPEDKTAVQALHKAHITPILEKILSKISASGKQSAWIPEDDSSLPLHLLEKAGYGFYQKGIVLEQDEVPSLERAFFLDIKQILSPAFCIEAFYLRSVNDKNHTFSYAKGDGNDNYTFNKLAHVIGLGTRLQLGNHIQLSLDYGKNLTAFAKNMNGTSLYEHELNGPNYTFQGRKEGSYPTFFALRLAGGKSDIKIPGSWNVFLDYKSFEHGAFFGGNGTEALPDRYLDGVKSYTIGLGYVPQENLLLEAFYTFAAKGLKKRATLYGEENFTLGNYTRVKLTYMF